MKFIFLVMLSCCGQAKVLFVVHHVDEELMADFDHLRNGLLDVMEVKFDDSGVDIVIDSLAIQERIDSGVDTTGFYDGSHKIFIPDIAVPLHYPGVSNFTLSAAGRRVVMAHEIGHALGLHHSDHGLMTISINGFCIDKEAECLRNALIEAGIIHQT